MVNSSRRLYVIVALLLMVVMTSLFVLPLSTAPALARPPLDDPGDDQEASGQPVQPAEFPDEPQPDQENGDQAGIGAAAYIVNPTMNYQGYLTDAGGHAVNDTLDFTVSLWDDPTSGTQVWGPETHSNVDVANGLFSLVLGSNVTFDVSDLYQALYLEIEVDGTTLPRQPLRGVPYAMTLAPGATISGEDDTRPTVSINQNGENFGLWVQEDGSTVDYGLGADKIYSDEGYASGADSYLWVPGSLAYTSGPVGSANFTPQSSGILEVDCIGTGSIPLYIPVAVPSRLYGHNVVVEEARVYYRVDNAGSPVYLSRVRKLLADGTAEEIATELNDQASTTYTSFSVPINATSGYTLTASAGPLTVLVGWDCNNTGHNFYLGGVRLRLGHPRSDQ